MTDSRPYGHDVAPIDDRLVAPGPTIQDIERRIQRELRRREKWDRVGEVVYPVGFFALVLVVWELAVRLLHVPNYLLPTPTAILAELISRFTLLVQQGWVTTQEILLGYLLSVVIGIGLAMAIFASPLVRRSVYPLLVSSQSIPKSAVAPLFVVWFGFGIASKLLMTFLIAFFPIVINTVIGLGSIEQEKVWLAQSMGLNPWQTFFKIRLPQATPSIFGGLKIAITLAVIGAIVGEFVGASAGLGYLLLVANGALDTNLLFAGLVSLTLIGIVSFGLIAAVESLAIPWHRARSASAREP